MVNHRKEIASCATAIQIHFVRAVLKGRQLLSHIVIIIVLHLYRHWFYGGHLVLVFEILLFTHVTLVVCGRSRRFLCWPTAFFVHQGTILRHPVRTEF